jgi:NADH:ubiquinone oxidoreductase subunit 2 (subunit N)
MLAMQTAARQAVATEGASEFRVPLLIGMASALALLALVTTALASPVWRHWAVLMFLSGAPAVLGLFVESATLRLVLLETSSLIALLMVWKSAKAKAAVWTFLAVIVASAATLIPGLLLLEHGNAELARTLLIAGFFVKLGLVPFFLWLPKVAEQVPSLVMALIISVIDIAAFGELCVVAKVAPWVFEPKGLWLGAGALSALLAAVLMLAEPNIKRMLALSTVEDIGFLTFGLVSFITLGYEGAVVGAAVHALAKALLFISISAPEANGELRADSQALASRYPVSAAGFLFGMLAMIGIPPTLGFIGRWRLYETAVQHGTVWLVVLIVSSMLSLIAYVRALTGTWWGAPPWSISLIAGKVEAELTEVIPNSQQSPLESVVGKINIVLLAAVLVVAGALPFGLEYLLRGIR